MLLTLQVSALLLPEPSTGFLDPSRKGNLDILRHRFLAASHAARVLRVAHHHLDPLDSLLAIVKAARNLLRQALDDALVLPPYILVAESRKQVLLVQLIELRGLLRDIPQQLGDFFLDIDPARRQEVHFYHHVAIFVRFGDQAPALLWLRWEVETIGGSEARFLGWVVGEGLAVGDVAGRGRMELVLTW